MKGNVAQLKDKIDSGQTGDKVAFPDPAMAPLGTDDEAGGSPTHPDLVQKTIEVETVRVRQTESLSGFTAMLVLIALILLCFLAGVYFLT